MTTPVSFLSKLGESSGALGSVISAMGCAMCFPAIASIGAAIGLGFLDQWEHLFRTTLMPIFALLALLASLLGWFAHHNFMRSLFGIIGPILVLLALYPLFSASSRNVVLYSGLAMMLAFAVWDIFFRKKAVKV